MPIPICFGCFCCCLSARSGRAAAAKSPPSSIPAPKRPGRSPAKRAAARAAGLPLLRLLALGLFILGLARPQLGHATTEVNASGIDMMLAIDVSGSMQSLDFKVDGQPVDRVGIVKTVVSKFIDQRPNDRLGLVEFAGAPYLVSPLTLDHDWLQQNLERVKVGSIEDGTAIGSAIAMCANRLREEPSKSKVIVLLTDGENNSGKISPLMAAEAAKALGIKIYTIGAGVRGEAPMPMKDQFGNTRMVMVKSDVDEATLGKIAEETGGRFFRATDTELAPGHLRADRPVAKDHAHDQKIRASLRAVRVGRCCPVSAFSGRAWASNKPVTAAYPDLTHPAATNLLPL